MGFDIRGRWVPSEDINWSQDRQDLRMELTASGLDWRHEGKYAFRTDAWGQMTESQRLDTLQVYDSWYDEGGQQDLNDEKWGLDIERSITYNDTWDAQTAFHQLTGGELKQMKLPWSRGVVSVREYPMDWKHYSNDELYRATIDELSEQYEGIFIGSGDDFTNTTQVRAANQEIKSWVDERYSQANELGKDGAWAEEQVEADTKLQIARCKLENKRWPEGKKRGPYENQAVAIKKYQPWNKFDPETGTRTKLNPITGEILDTFKHTLAPEPTRMTIVGDKLEQNRDEGIFYSSSVGREQEITGDIKAKPPDISKPSISIRKVKPSKPANMDANWKLKGDVK